MSAGGVGMQAGRYFMVAQGKEVTDAVDGRHCVIVRRKHDESLRSAWGHLPFEGVFLFQFLRWIFSDKVLTGTSMGNAFLHGNHRIEQDLEVGTGLVTAV